jgi:hypothetical protein
LNATAISPKKYALYSKMPIGGTLIVEKISAEIGEWSLPDCASELAVKLKV